MADTGVSKVPISASPVVASTAYSGNGVNYNVYTLGLSSDTGNQIVGVNLSVPSGCGVALSNPPGSINTTMNVDIQASGSLTVYIYIPANTNTTVNLTASKAGFLNNVWQIH